LKKRTGRGLDNPTTAAVGDAGVDVPALALCAGYQFEILCCVDTFWDWDFKVVGCSAEQRLWQCAWWTTWAHHKVGNIRKIAEKTLSTTSLRNNTHKPKLTRDSVHTTPTRARRNKKQN
jgi:hypothetical protein